MQIHRATRLGLALLGVCLVSALAVASNAGTTTSEDPMMSGENGWSVTPLFTVSEVIDGYQPTGILDGTGAVRLSDNTIRVFVNSELNPGNGYGYELGNGTDLTGGRVHYFDIDRKCRTIKGAGLAYDTIYDREGSVVTDPQQINETGNSIDGLARLCSAQLVERNNYNFFDTIFFTGEETSKPFHPHGGTEWALDVKNGDLWACPDLGRGGWENVTAVETGSQQHVALLLGDDVQSAPLYLYVGEKKPSGNFLERNGLVGGTLYAWKADSGDLTPQTFNGYGATRTGTFVEIQARDAAKAGMPGYDSQGYLDGDTLRTKADALGAFSFSRPEDLHTNPRDGSQAVFASTGRGGLFPADNWGTVYVVDLDFPKQCKGTIAADLSIIHDADDLATPDKGIRSPDNLVWAENGHVYIQEDRSTSPSSLFGAVTGREASIWQLDPSNGNYEAVAEIDRSVVAPASTTDIGAGTIGVWESSGVLDVTSLFKTTKGETLLLATVQAHGIRDGAIGDNPKLDEGGQIILLSKTSK